MAKRKNWETIIEQLNSSPKRELKVRMGSPGSAQVTRCRLLENWNGLEVTTKGATLILRLPR